MALDQYSLAALINMQMGDRAPALDTVPPHSTVADYFWNAMGDALRRARVLSRMATSLPETAGAAVFDPVRQPEPV